MPSGADRIIQRCLEKLSSDRYYDAAELNSALERLLRQVGSDNPETCLGAELARVGLFLSSAGGPLPRGRKPTRVHNENGSRAVWGLAACFALVVAGGFAAQRGGARGGFASRLSGRLQLRPDRAGYLRLVADPWATVTIDGQIFDTTPFSRSIPLSAGTHYVHLEHPQAAPERRTVHIANGETVLLDVKMKLSEGSVADAGPPPISTQTNSDNSP